MLILREVVASIEDSSSALRHYARASTRSSEDQREIVRRAKTLRSCENRSPKTASKSCQTPFSSTEGIKLG